MATLFKQNGKGPYWARVKLWKASLGKSEWDKIPTKVYDADDALKIAEALEAASNKAKIGLMTRSHAENLVNRILEYAGVPWEVKALLLEEYGSAYVKASAARSKDPAKAKAPVHWQRLCKYAPVEVKWPMENWTEEMWSAYYQDLLTELSERTANDHIATFRQMYDKAIKSGKIQGNPVALIDKESNNSIEKDIFSRLEVARLLRIQRKLRKCSAEWSNLTLLGWHTGHRIQDLLDVLPEHLKEMPNVGWTVKIQPNKKIRKNGEVLGRTVILPIPTYLAERIQEMGGFKKLHNADNTNGKVSTEFTELMERAGIDPLRVERGKRSVARKSFHSFRHTLTTRLSAAGVEEKIAGLVTDHENEKMRAHYTHSEITQIANALNKLKNGKKDDSRKMKPAA